MVMSIIEAINGKISPAGRERIDVVDAGDVEEPKVWQKAKPGLRAALTAAFQSLNKANTCPNPGCDWVWNEELPAGIHYHMNYRNFRCGYPVLQMYGLTREEIDEMLVHCNHCEKVDLMQSSLETDHLRLLPGNECARKEQARRLENEEDLLPEPQIHCCNCSFSCYLQGSFETHLSGGDMACLMAENEQRAMFGVPLVVPDVLFFCQEMTCPSKKWEHLPIFFATYENLRTHYRHQHKGKLPSREAGKYLPARYSTSLEELGIEHSFPAELIGE